MSSALAPMRLGTDNAADIGPFCFFEQTLGAVDIDMAQQARPPARFGARQVENSLNAFKLLSQRGWRIYAALIRAPFKPFERQ